MSLRAPRLLSPHPRREGFRPWPGRARRILGLAMIGARLCTPLTRG